MGEPLLVSLFFDLFGQIASEHQMTIGIFCLICIAAIGDIVI